MKKIILLCLCLTAVKPTYAKDLSIYRNKLKQCEKAQKEFVSKTENQSTAKMKQSIYDLNDCYEQVAYEIIDKYYNKNSKEVKENLINFLKSTYAITGDIYMRADYCFNPIGACGTMVNLVYTSKTSYYLESIILDIISNLEKQE